MTLRTPNLAIDLIAKKLGARDEPQRPCLTVRAFHRLRKSIVTVANVPAKVFDTSRVSEHFQHSPAFQFLVALTTPNG